MSMRKHKRQVQQAQWAWSQHGNEVWASGVVPVAWYVRSRNPRHRPPRAMRLSGSIGRVERFSAIFTGAV